MKRHIKIENIIALLSLFVGFLLINCSGDDSSGTNVLPAEIIVTGSLTSFEDTDVLSHSVSKNVQISSNNLTANLNITVADNFEISLNDTNFSNQLTISKDDANLGSTTLYVRFSPSESAIGNNIGAVSLQSSQATTITIALSGVGLSITPVINVNQTSYSFDDTVISQISSALNLIVNGDNLESDINLSVTEGFEISLDNSVFTDTLIILAANANEETTLYVRFIPSAIGSIVGTMILQNTEADDVEVDLYGIGLPIIHNYITFDSERLAFGSGFNQSSTQAFNLHNDMSNIETVKMYVQLRCPTGGCDEWDVYANVKVMDADSGEMYELGRYITPYWNDNSQLERGFEFDVTDFKSLLSGSTELRIRTECWNVRGYEVTVDFDYIEGTPDYPYYAISRVLAYDNWSSSGVPYGVANSFDLNKTITIPNNAESTHLRTIISGWGHATPNDSGNRPCAEWCYRTHDVLIDGSNTFQHEMGTIGCASNPVSNQSPGNWQQDRAGWCPGMVVPVRIDEFLSSMAGNMFTFEYDYEDWTSDGLNGNAYYATSAFVVVKSNTMINKPQVME